MKLKTIDLPRKYEYKEGISRPEYKKYDGWNKISYSAANSFKDELYRGDFFGGYFLGVWGEAGIFALFGSDCGDYVNTSDDRECLFLSEEDKVILEELKKDHPEDSEFEYEILIDLEPFGLKNTVLQGFSDRQNPVEKGSKKIDVADYKTLNLEKKRDYYTSDEYEQLNIYGYGLEELGFEIRDTYVIGLGRKGNSLEPGAKHPLRLSGEVERLDNPYNREKAIKAVEDIVKVCEEIHEYYKVFKKYFVEK